MYLFAFVFAFMAFPWGKILSQYGMVENFKLKSQNVNIYVLGSVAVKRHHD